MKKLLYAALLLILSGCAYFNVFYNAEYYYAQGIKPLNTGGQVRKDLLEKSIEKSSKILEFHSESKYVDDALILIGKSYMYLGDYTKAIRKFNELISYYSQSPYYDEAVYYLGNTYRLQGEAEIAMAYFQRLYDAESEYRTKAIIASIDMLSEEEKFISADSLISGLSKRDMANQSIMYSAAKVKFHTGKYDEAVADLEKVNPGKLESLERFNYYIIYIKALTGSKQAEKAMKIADSSLKFFPEEKLRNSILMRKAEILVNEGKYLDAVSLIEDVLAQSQKVALRDSFIYLEGMIYEINLEEYEKARDTYKKILSEERRSLLVPETEVRVRTLDLLLDISSDSVSNAEQLAKNRFLLAEINYLSLGRIDEAIRNYSFVADSYPDDFHAAKSLYALAYIQLNDLNDTLAAESLLTVICEEHRNSEFYISAENLLERIKHDKPYSEE